MILHERFRRWELKAFAVPQRSLGQCGFNEEGTGVSMAVV